MTDPTVELQIRCNHFAQFDPDVAVPPNPPNPIIGGGAVGIVVQGAEASTAIQQSLCQGKTFGYASPINNLNSTFISVTASGPSYHTNSINITNVSMQRFIAGGTSGETLNGTTNAEILFQVLAMIS